MPVKAPACGRRAFPRRVTGKLYRACRQPNSTSISFAISLAINGAPSTTVFLTLGGSECGPLPNFDNATPNFLDSFCRKMVRFPQSGGFFGRVSALSAFRGVTYKPRANISSFGGIVRNGRIRAVTLSGKREPGHGLGRASNAPKPKRDSAPS